MLITLREAFSNVVAFPLGPNASKAGYRVIGFDSIGSTNAEAMKAAAAGDAPNIWYVALQQTEGRGRRGRQWESPYGNLAASLMIAPEAPADHLATLGFVAGVALNRALNQLVPQMRTRSGLDGADGVSQEGPVRIALKWPNDILADGAKLAGILLEVQPRFDGSKAIVIGFGVNVVAAPAGLPYPATALSAFNGALDAQAVFEALAEHWVECYALWNNGAGTREILAGWREFATGIGTEVAVKRNSDVIRGVFETIDDAGRLIVRDAEGHRTAIAAGDVHFGTTASLKA